MRHLIFTSIVCFGIGTFKASGQSKDTDTSYAAKCESFKANLLALMEKYPVELYDPFFVRDTRDKINTTNDDKTQPESTFLEKARKETDSLNQLIRDEFAKFFVSKYAGKEYRITENLLELKELKNNILLYKVELDKISNTLKKNAGLWKRKIDYPFSDYNHVKSPYKNESYVFYKFNPLDEKGYIGIFYQTNAYYCRDAIEINTNFYRDSVEHFSGVYYVNFKDGKHLVNLVSSNNNLMERKVFELNITTSTLNKLYEYKAANNFPFSLSSYTLYNEDSTVFKTTLKEKFNFICHDPNASYEREKIYGIEKLDNNKLKDYFYPIKVSHQKTTREGWVYVGEFQIKPKQNERSEYIFSQTNLCRKKKLIFFRYKDDLDRISKKKLEKSKKIKFAPLDICYIRNKPKPDNGIVIGEAEPENEYYITELKKYEIGSNSYILWAKVVLIE